MSATILPFTRKPVADPPVAAKARAVANLAEHFGDHWAKRHMPLVVAALDLLQAEDADFVERCELIEAEPGAMVRLLDQLSRLADHMADVAGALALTVQRIRSVTAKSQGKPA